MSSWKTGQQVYSYDSSSGVTHKMIYHGHEQIEEQRSPSGLHLHLHRTAAFESAPASDNESKVVCP